MLNKLYQKTIEQWLVNGNFRYINFSCVRPFLSTECHQSTRIAIFVPSNEGVRTGGKDSLLYRNPCNSIINYTVELTWHIRLQIIHWHFTGLINSRGRQHDEYSWNEIYEQWREKWQMIHSHTRGQTKVDFGILIERLAFDTVNFVQFCHLSANTNEHTFNESVCLWICKWIFKLPWIVHSWINWLET